MLLSVKTYVHLDDCHESFDNAWSLDMIAFEIWFSHRMQLRQYASLLCSFGDCWRDLETKQANYISVCALFWPAMTIVVWLQLCWRPIQLARLLHHAEHDDLRALPGQVQPTRQPLRQGNLQKLGKRLLYAATKASRREAALQGMCSFFICPHVKSAVRLASSRLHTFHPSKSLSFANLRKMLHAFLRNLPLSLALDYRKVVVWKLCDLLIKSRIRNLVALCWEFVGNLCIRIAE